LSYYDNKGKNMTTKEVAEKLGVARVTVTMWCKKQHGLKRKLGTNSIMEYELTDKDIEAFKSRKPVGRPNVKNPVRPRKSTRK
jgi:uncharacterized protein YjcR